MLSKPSSSLHHPEILQSCKPSRRHSPSWRNRLRESGTEITIESRSDERADLDGNTTPQLNADTRQNMTGQPIEITFAEVLVKFQ
ncbi:hypothetical protein [Paenibacillus phytorum]|uniref:hypothetical protein n=1 Tax=Paenibacillus phytorum TaxID=2654977 RepID=UPI001490EA34|nr:hypothetical protein [Paenibacillus phytorum]